MQIIQLKHAIGNIQASSRQSERLDEVCARLQIDEFYKATNELIPSACIDGRSGGTQRPNAAGGTNTIVVAEDLTNDVDLDYLATYRDVVTRLSSNNVAIGGHDDEHSNNEKSGCGACDSLADIYNFIASKGGVIRETLTSLGVTIMDDAFEKIILNARARNEFSSGPNIRAVLKSAGGIIDHLRGEHNEVVVVINLRHHTTLDREKLEKEFGPYYEAFNVDVWAFPEAAKWIGSSVDEEDKVAAMLIYNLATAHVLCGPSMRVIVRD